MTKQHEEQTETEIESNEDGGLFSLTPEERTEQFKKLLEELDEKPTELARRLRGLGDYRAFPAIMRSIQRMAAGDTAVSAESMVIIRMLVNQQRLRDREHSHVEWKQQPNGVWTATVSGFAVSLHPKTKQRWHIALTFIENGYSPAWQPWPTGVDAAKRKAMACVADGLLEVCDLEAGRL